MFWHQVLTRRWMLKKAGVLVAVLAFGKYTQAQPSDDIVPEPAPTYTLEERLEPILAGRVPKPERVTLTIPAYAEDGRVVPVHIAVESPMTDTDYVRALSLVVDNNPDPLIFTASLHPSLAKVEWKVNIRLADDSRVRAIAEMSDGELFVDETEVEVLLSGCG